MLNILQPYFIDNQPPVFEYCPVDQYKNTSLTESTALAVWKDPEVIDNSGNFLNATCYPQKGIFSIGRTEVHCEAIDGNQNSAKCSFNVIVFGKNKQTIINP